MSKQLKVYCVNIGEYLPIDGGMTLREIYENIKKRISFTPVCARVNNKAEDLSFPVFTPKQIEFLSVDSPSGYRCYIRSLCMVLYRAVVSLYPGTRLVISHSVSRGYYCRLSGTDVDSSIAEALKTEMSRIISLDLPFERKERLTSDVIEIMRGQGLTDKVKLLSSIQDLYTVYYRLDGVCDTYNGNLVPSTNNIRFT